MTLFDSSDTMGADAMGVDAMILKYENFEMRYFGKAA